MQEIISDIIFSLVHIKVPIMKDVRTKGDGARAAEQIKNTLIDMSYRGDPKDSASHELSHMWMAAKHHIPVETGIFINFFTRQVDATYVKTQIPFNQIDPGIRANIASAPNLDLGQKLTTQRMSDYDERLFYAAVDQAVEKRIQEEMRLQTL